jgi:hypothetical protein
MTKLQYPLCGPQVCLQRAACLTCLLQAMSRPVIGLLYLYLTFTWSLCSNVLKYPVCSIFIGGGMYPPIKMEQTECPDRLVYKLQKAYHNVMCALLNKQLIFVFQNCCGVSPRFCLSKIWKKLSHRKCLCVQEDTFLRATRCSRTTGWAVLPYSNCLHACIYSRPWPA